MTAGVLLLAAGRAQRFGADKRQAILPDGRRVLDTTLQNILASGLPLTVCVADDDDALVHHMQGQGFACQRCNRAGEGMGATLAQGVSHALHWSGVLVALADMPWIAPDTYTTVAQRLTVKTIVVPVYQGQRGHPVGFGCEFYPELRALGGDAGARSLLMNHAEAVTEVTVSDPAILRDLDLPADLPSRG
jgi:molybdenum cofactor cytidylyltransferase